MCPQCNGPGVLLGRWGRYFHFRCRNCGWDFRLKDDDPAIELTLGLDLPDSLSDSSEQD